MLTERDHTRLEGNDDSGFQVGLYRWFQQQRADYAALIAKSFRKKVKPTAITIETFMKSGDWAVVYADVPVADPGYFFFNLSGKTPKLKDVWGGMADRSEVPELVKWAKKLGANEKVASCFADTATAS
jgi:hypothetical protein